MTRMRDICLACSLVALICGCDRGPSLSEIEANERASRIYKNAVDDLQAGRMDAAIKGFERVVLQEPNSYSAHFQLATLLQDVRKDYISAIAHYRDYLALRPASDKATVAQDRVKVCETLLGAEVLRKVGGSATNKLSADNEKLANECESLTAQVKKLEGELAKAKRDVARLEAECASKSRLLAKLSSADDVAASKNSSVKEALAELKEEKDEVERRRLRPTDAELLDDDDAPPPVSRVRASDELKKMKGELAKLDAEPPPTVTPKGAGAGKDKDAPRPGSFDTLVAGRKAKPQQAAPGARPETYTVQEGDTLFKISTRFYGSSHKWRAIQDANRAIIPADGRVRAGQVLKLP